MGFTTAEHASLCLSTISIHRGGSILHLSFSGSTLPCCFSLQPFTRRCLSLFGKRDVRQLWTFSIANLPSGDFCYVRLFFVLNRILFLRFFFIVLTDSTCWAPIIILKILAFTDFEVSGDAYAWLVVFILPLNSAVNPFLFTFSTPKYRDQIYTTFSKRSFTKKQDSNSHQQGRDCTWFRIRLIHIIFPFLPFAVTAEDSQTKAQPPFSSSSTNSSNKWTFLRKKS